MEKLTNIKGVFLDLGYTLLYPISGSFMFSNLAKKYFPQEILDTASPGQLQGLTERLRRTLDTGPQGLTIEDEYKIFHQYYASLSELLGLRLSPADIKAVADDKVYNRTDNILLFGDTAAALRALHGKYRLGIISDTWPAIVPVLEALDILKYFDCATYSYELGTLKPDKRMYLDALQKMGLPPEETLFVDDSPKNIAGAAGLGIHPVLITAKVSAGLDRAFGIDKLQAAAPPVPHPPRAQGAAHAIDSLSGLLELLGEEGA